MTEPSAIELRNVSFSYGSVVALRDINFNVAKNDLICVVGPNGGGKTTFLKLIVGLLRPDSGEVRIFGHNPVQVRNLIGYMPQSPNLDPSFPINVLEVVLMGRLQHCWFGPYRAADKKAARDALAEVDMAGFDHRPFAALSGGQRQRVLIARALTANPRLLVLDEPTANIDPVQENLLHQILTRLKEHMTIIMVTHDFVSDMVEEVVCVNQSLEIHPTSRLEGHAATELHGLPGGRIVRHDRRVGENQGGGCS